MGVVILRPVADFFDSLDPMTRGEVSNLIELLGHYGHTLAMPHAKAIGKGLHELRYTGHPQIRILYGFCHGEAVLVHAFKKQRPALPTRGIQLGLKRLSAYCA